MFWVHSRDILVGLKEAWEEADQENRDELMSENTKTKSIALISLLPSFFLFFQGTFFRLHIMIAKIYRKIKDETRNYQHRFS